MFDGITCFFLSKTEKMLGSWPIHRTFDIMKIVLNFKIMLEKACTLVKRWYVSGNATVNHLCGKSEISVG